MVCPPQSLSHEEKMLTIAAYPVFQDKKAPRPYFHLLRNHEWAPTINIEKLWSLVPLETRDKYVSGAKTDSAPVIDLLANGYAKLLGKGRLPEIPVVVRARYVSAEAERKIVEAGGVIELVA
ncbi:60S ribosomal protein L28 [Podospora pseudocomata]|uniref:60S ribosomal protein L28 n=2 Tax=Podospora TaxID=5144 RepID=A0ABR0HRF3_9PEZI|nr:60S ribosomal protein L28 [Podospora pseudocomata]KAK4670436.1 60S ribosomal protein L28 [Podospora pseudopauciseta]